jgi:hypothetical protein
MNTYTYLSRIIRFTILFDDFTLIDLENADETFFLHHDDLYQRVENKVPKQLLEITNKKTGCVFYRNYIVGFYRENNYIYCNVDACVYPLLDECDSYWLCNLCDKTIYYSDRFWQDIGYGEEHPCWSDVIYPEDLEVQKQIIQSGKPFCVNIRYLSKHNEEQIFRSNGQIVKRSEGQPIFICIMTDVTEQYNLRKMVRDYNDYMNEMGHELHNLLNIINGYTQLISLHKNKDVSEYTDIIKRTTNKAVKLVSNGVYMSKSKPTDCPEETNIYCLLKEKLEIDIREDCNVIVDKNGLSEVLDIILYNSDRETGRTKSTVYRTVDQFTIIISYSNVISKEQNILLIPAKVICYNIGGSLNIVDSDVIITLRPSDTVKDKLCCF